MSALTENPSIPVPRGDLRLLMVEDPGRHRLDGGWWPYSRDLVAELTDLVRHFPSARGRITRALYSRPDWDTAPHRVDLGTKVLKVGSFPDDETHVVVVQTADGERITLLVVPPRFTRAQGDEALLAAATPGNEHSGTELLLEVTNNHEADPADQWGRTEDGMPRSLGPAPDSGQASAPIER